MARSTQDGSQAELVPRSAAEGGDYVVVARRYRPQNFGELIGQEHVARGLTNAILQNRVGHAYLFTGARGVGKTSSARILAKALNCVHGPTPNPCNECDICRSISSGDDVDVLEIDGASNRGIDEIRQLRQNVNVRPSRARFKIYIIDEVHMLTREAFNALLKTLEEPPEHVKFIFCTTEAEKIPITILSRCQRFDFAGIQAPSIVERLSQIAQAEGVPAERAALELLARRAGGSMRDSQSLLEQLLAFGSQGITAEAVHEMLGTASSARLSKVISHLVARDAAAALAEVSGAVAEGVDIGQFLDQLLGYLRDCMAAAVGCSPDAFLNAGPTEAEEIVQASQQLGLETILAMIGILDQTLSRLRYSSHGRVLAEMALVRMCRLEDLEALPELIAQVRSGIAPEPAPRQQTAPSSARDMPAAAATAEPEPTAKKKEPELNGHAQEAAAVASVNAATPEVQPPATLATPLTGENAAAIWAEALNTLGDMVADCGRQAVAVASPAPNRLVVTFPAKYNFGKTYCERPEQLSRLEQALAEATGDRIRLEFVLAAEEQVKPEAAPRPRRAASSQQRMMEKAQHPLVQRASELFGAVPIRLEEPAEAKPDGP